MENLTELERAAIIFHIFGGCKDRKILYQIANGENKVNKLKPSSLDVMCGNWYRSHKIQSAIKYFESLKQENEKEIIKNYLSGIETEATKETKENTPNENTNFLDRDEFLQFLNDRANQITDDKLRNDILKMLSDNLRYKDTERDENNEIQRFYTPVNCENCTIYNKCKDCKLSKCPEML